MDKLQHRVRQKTLCSIWLLFFNYTIAESIYENRPTSPPVGLTVFYLSFRPRNGSFSAFFRCRNAASTFGGVSSRT